MGRETYYVPDNQINKTNSYNEMDFNRIQNGKKKQPDYIIVFKNDGAIPQLEEAKKASKDWGDMPIVVIDLEKCLESERKKVEDMLVNYKGDKLMVKEIKQKVRNNRVTFTDFCNDLQNKINVLDYQDEEKENPVDIKIEDLEQNYKEISEDEREKEVSKIKNIRNKIRKVIKSEPEELSL